MDQKKFEIGTIVRMIGQDILLTVEADYHSQKTNVIWFDHHGVLHRDCISRDLLTRDTCGNGEDDFNSEICIEADNVKVAHDSVELKVDRAFINRKINGDVTIALYSAAAYEEYCKRF